MNAPFAHRVFLCLVFVICMDLAAILADEIEEPASIQKVIRATSADALRAAISTSFNRMSESALNHLLVHEDDGIAIRAAWESIRRNAKNAKQGSQIDRLALSHFAGFIQGRVRAPIPKWWKSHLTNCFSASGGDLYFQNVDCPYRRDSVGILHPPAIQLTKTGSGLKVGIDGTSLILNNDLFAKLSRPLDAISVVRADDNRYVVACHSSRMASYHVLGVDHDATVCWSADVWGNEDLHDFEGSGYHEIDMVYHEGAVYLFGASDEATYLVAIKTKDGTVLMRFATSY